MFEPWVLLMGLLILALGLGALFLIMMSSS
jgi:hypothetical protein